MRVTTIVLAAAFATTAALGTAPAHAYKIQRGLDSLWLKYGLQGYDRDTQTLYRFHLTEDGVKPRTDRYATTHLDRQWTHIVPASIGPNLGTVCYDGVNGRVEITGPYSGKKTYTDFHKGLDIVMSFGAGTLYYDKQSGFAKIYKIHTDDTNMLLQPGKHNYGAPVFKGTWRKGWDIIQQFPLIRKGKHYVLFYDREAGYSVICDFIDGEKPGTRSDKATTWRKT